jgi:hypothetical protein
MTIKIYWDNENKCWRYGRETSSELVPLKELKINFYRNIFKPSMGWLVRHK